MPEPPLRRADDARLEAFERKLDRIEEKVDEMRETLADPDRTLLGRQLIARANTNAANIASLADKVDSLESWRDQMRGSWGFVRSTQVVLGIIVALLTLWATTSGLKP